MQSIIHLLLLALLSLVPNSNAKFLGLPRGPILTTNDFKQAPNDPRLEYVLITDLYVHKSQTGDILAISFNLSGKRHPGIKCEANKSDHNDLEMPSPVYRCGAAGESPYRFALFHGEDTNFSLRVYVAHGVDLPLAGKEDVLTRCRIDDARNDTVCHQIMEVEIVLYPLEEGFMWSDQDRMVRDEEVNKIEEIALAENDSEYEDALALNVSSRHRQN